MNNFVKIEMDEDMDIDWVDELDYRAGTPTELILAADVVATEVIPAKSKKRYEENYAGFQKWKTSKGATSNSQTVLLAFFFGLASKNKPSTLWARYSMLKTTMKIYDDIDIGTYTKLTSFLKQNSAGYRPNKASIFSEVEIKRFISEAPDDVWLDVKVVCIFGISGACRTHEFPDILVQNVTKHGDLVLVKMHDTKTKIQRSFSVTGTFCSVVEKYIALRPRNVTTDRFFCNYQRGKCTVQPIGKNKFYGMPSRIATFLNLPEPKGYTGHSFRRSSATILANTGAIIDTVKRDGGWASNKVAEQYIENSLHYEGRTEKLINSSINCSRSTYVSSSSVADDLISADPLIDSDKPCAIETDIDRGTTQVATQWNYVTQQYKQKVNKHLNVAESNASEAAILYRDERTLQYFFVCFHCRASYETTEEILKHVNVHYQVNVIFKLPYDEDETTEHAPTITMELQQSNNAFENFSTVWHADVKEENISDDNTSEILTETDSPTILEAVHVGNSCDDDTNPDVTCLKRSKDDDAINDISDDETVTESPITTTLTTDIYDQETSDGRPVALERTLVNDTNVRSSIEQSTTKSAEEFQCKLCKLNFHRNETLLSHLMKIHQKNVKLKCLLVSCGKKFVSQNVYELHLIRHIRDNSVTSENVTKAINRIVERAFSTDDLRKLHVNVCDICSFKFSNKKNLERHLENHRMYFKCKVCSKFLETPARLITHSMKMHDNMKTPKCKCCGQIFKYFNSLEKHLFDAHIATKAFTNYDLINSLTDSVKKGNVPLDENIRPEMYQCDLCKKEFYAKKCLENHMLTAHLKSKNNQRSNENINVNQSECTRINPNISEWDEGILMKNFDKFLNENVAQNPIGEYITNYECKLCDFQCNQIMTATLHISQNHLKHLYRVASNAFVERDVTRNWNISFNNPIACKFCDRLLYQRSGINGLKSHILLNHNEISCNQCNLTFKQNIDFHAHYLEHLRIGSKRGPWNDNTLMENLSKFVKEKMIFGENHYICLICGKRCEDPDEMFIHIRMHICKVTCPKFVQYAN